MSRHTPIGSRFAVNGQWVTDEDGNEIVQIVEDLHTGDRALLSSFDHWNIPKPNTGSVIPKYSEVSPGKAWVRQVGNYKTQIYVNGKWVP